MSQIKDHVPADASLTQRYQKDKKSFDRRKIKLSSKNGDAPLEILFLGDTSFGENYQTKIENSGLENILKSRGYDYPLKKMTSLLTSADLVIANLETPLTDIKISPYAEKKSYVHWSDIVKAPLHLQKHNIQVVSLANNHTFDYGREGFTQTLNILEKENIHYFGAGHNQQEANKPFFIEANIGGKPFSCAIIGAFQESASYRRDYQAYAEDEKGGVNSLNTDAIIEQMRIVKAQNPDTFIIIFPHWGFNYAWKADFQVAVANRLIEHGADLILGHGAHMLQEIEQYQNKWIAYSIGNFMFNSPGRYAHYKAPPYSFVAKLVITPHKDTFLLSCRLYPIMTDNKITDYQTSFATQKQFNEICQILIDKNTSSNTFLYGLARSKDKHGYYLELPINKDHTNSMRSDENRIGFLCNIRNGVVTGESPKKWMFRALSMNESLRREGVELFIYAYNHINPETGLVSGYVIENNQFVKKEAPVPKVSYDWFLGSRAGSHEHSMNKAQFFDWVEKRNFHTYPHNAYAFISNDKLISYKIVAEFDNQLPIYTELYNGTIDQLQQLIQKTSTAFIKPQFGNRGIGIIVLKRVKNAYTLSHYEEEKKSYFKFESLADAQLKTNQLIENKPYIIQSGIVTARVNSSTFDIRVIVMGERDSWEFIQVARIGESGSDLSNISQGGHYIELNYLLEKFADKINVSVFKNRLTGVISRLTSFLDAYSPSKMLEIAYDVIVDSNFKIHITEINCKPGSPMITEQFNDFFRLNEKEKLLYKKHILPHGKILSKNMLTRLLASKESQQKIWFDTLLAPPSIDPIDKTALMHELYSALNNHRRLIKDNLPTAVKADKSARILFVSISNGFTKAQVAMGTGLGLVSALELALNKLPMLFKEAYKPIWVKLDIVTDSTTRHQVDLNKPLNFDRSLHGLAFTKELDIAFLPEQLNAYTLVTSNTHLHPRNIAKYLSSNPYLYYTSKKLTNLNFSTVHQFNTDSLFYDGSTVIPLYRGHKFSHSLSNETLLESVDLAVDYLIRSVDLNGKFAYSYEPKIDNTNTTYNILRHAGTVYSMLEVYELTKDIKVITAATRAIRYLISQLRDTVVNNEATLVVIEEGYVKLGGNALAALALAKYTQITQERTYIPILQKLGAWIVNTQNDQGAFTVHKQAFEGVINTTFESEYYPGEALFALARLFQLDPQQRWLEGAVKGALFIITVRDKDVPDRKMNHDHWLLYALNEIYTLRPNKILLSHAMRIADVIINNQRIKSNTLDWIGSYYDPPRSTPAATRMEGLCASYHLAYHHVGSDQADKILKAIKLGVHFQLHTQLTPESAMYLPNPQRAIGGFHRSLTDFEIRIDYVQHNISSLLGLYKILNLPPRK